MLRWIWFNASCPKSANLQQCIHSERQIKRILPCALADIVIVTHPSITGSYFMQMILVEAIQDGHLDSYMLFQISSCMVQCICAPGHAITHLPAEILPDETPTNCIHAIWEKTNEGWNRSFLDCLIIHGQQHSLLYLTPMTQLNARPCSLCKGRMDADTNTKVKTLETIQIILDEAMVSVDSKRFQDMLSRSIRGLYDMCEEHWCNSEHTSVGILADIMEKWIKKYKPSGSALVYNYLCKAMLLSHQPSDEWMDYLAKAKRVAKQQIFWAKYLFPKVCVVEGDILSNCEAEKALEAYSEAISFCQENFGLFPLAQTLLEAKSYMLQSLYKSAILSKDIQSPEFVLKLLRKAKKYAIQVQDANGYLVSQIQEAEHHQNMKMREQQILEHQRQLEKVEEPVKLYQREIDIPVGQTKKPFTLILSYLEDEKKMTVTLCDRENKQTISKQVPFNLKDMSYNSFIGDNYKKWMTINQHLQITVDEKRLGKVSNGEAVATRPLQKGKLYKIVTKQQIHPNRSTNSGWESSNEEIISKEVQKGNKTSKNRQK